PHPTKSWRCCAVRSPARWRRATPISRNGSGDRLADGRPRRASEEPGDFLLLAVHVAVELRRLFLQHEVPGVDGELDLAPRSPSDHPALDAAPLMELSLAVDEIASAND